MDFIDYTSQANAPVNVKPQGWGGWHPQGIWLNFLTHGLGMIKDLM